MGNSVKYNSSAVEPFSLKKGNFYIGTGDVQKGPSNFWNTITPPNGGYTIYLDKPTNGPSIYVANNDTELIFITNQIASASYTTANECLTYYAGQNDKMVFNRDCDEIITDGLVFYLDAGFTSSYPKTGTTWYNLGGSPNATFINGPSYNSGNGGSIAFDGTDDYVTTTSFYLSTSPASILVWFKAGTQTSNTSSILRPIMQQGLFDGAFPTRTQGIEINMMRSGSDVVGKLRFAWGGDTDPNYSYITNNRYDDDQWHFACNINNGSTFDVYVDGIYLTTKTTHTSVSTSTPVNFGGDSLVGARKLVGNIAIAQIYNKALTQAEVIRNYDAQKTRFGLM